MRCMRNLTFAFREVSSSKVNEILALIKTFLFTRTLLYFDEDWKTLSKMIITLSDTYIVASFKSVGRSNDTSFKWLVNHESFFRSFSIYMYFIGVILCDGDLSFCNKMKNFRKFAKIFLRLLSFLSIKPTIYCGFSAIGPVEWKKISIINYPLYYSL